MHTQFDRWLDTLEEHMAEPKTHSGMDYPRGVGGAPGIDRERDRGILGTHGRRALVADDYRTDEQTGLCQLSKALRHQGDEEKIASTKGVALA